jgi:hypothetical protein
MKLKAEMRRMWSGAELLGLRREAKRHAAFQVRQNYSRDRKSCVRAKAVSPLRSATAVQNALGTKEWNGSLFGWMKKLAEIRGRARNDFLTTDAHG